MASRTSKESLLCVLIIVTTLCIASATGLVSMDILSDTFSKHLDVLISTSFSLYDTNQYHINEFPGFLSDEECDMLISLARAKGLEPSQVYAADSDVVNRDTRISEQTWIKDTDTDLVRAISKRVSEITGYPIAHQEDLQVVHYGTGGKFSPHYDPCVLSKSECKRMNGKAGGRVFTFLIYLNDDCEGGDTIFPKADIRVRPEKGKAIMFRSLDDEGMLIRKSEHGGEKVISGDKWICNKWVRELPYG